MRNDRAKVVQTSESRWAILSLPSEQPVAAEIPSYDLARFFSWCYAAYQEGAWMRFVTKIRKKKTKGTEEPTLWVEKD